MEKTITVDTQKEYDEITALIKKTDKANPKPEDAEALQLALKNESGKIFFRHIGNMQNQVFLSLLKQASGHSYLAQETTKKYIEEMKVKLGFENSTFIEKMLIDEIILRWLRLQGVETQHHNSTKDSHTLTGGVYWDKRLDVAQKRFLRSIETLAKIRKLMAQTQAKGAEMFKTLIEADKQNNG